jgi:hypothetical protein
MSKQEIVMVRRRPHGPLEMEMRPLSSCCSRQAGSMSK